MSIICPSCHNKEPEGALFCSECGSKIIAENGLATASIQATNSIISQPPPASPPPPPIPTIEGIVSLHIVRTGQILPLVGRDEFTIGRISEGQSILPDIDLTPFEAYSQGVSRLHTTIKIQGQEVMIVDLGSSNGTQINKEKLVPHREYLLKHGDMIALGRFKIQALIRQEE